MSVCLMHQCISSSSHSVLHQHRNCHGTHASRNRCDKTRLLLHSYNKSDIQEIRSDQMYTVNQAFTTARMKQ